MKSLVTIPDALLDAEQARDPEGFRGEYEAMFVGGGAAFLDPDRIAEAVADRGELAPGQATGWVAGIDPAFSSDPFGLAIVGHVRDYPGAPDRLVLGLARAWKPTRAVSFEERRMMEDAVLAEVAAVCVRYHAHVITDQYAAPAVVNYLRRRGLSVELCPMAAASKSEAFGELRAQLNAGRLELYEHPDVLGELRRLRTRVRGRQRIRREPAWPPMGVHSPTTTNSEYVRAIVTEKTPSVRSKLVTMLPRSLSRPR